MDIISDEEEDEMLIRCKNCNTLMRLSDERLHSFTCAEAVFSPSPTPSSPYTSPHYPALKKGLKLDFKSPDAVAPTIALLLARPAFLSLPLWLNADVLPGPDRAHHPPQLRPVPALPFLASCRALSPDVVLSLGWTTCAVAHCRYGESEREAMRELCAGIEGNVTLAVRAAYYLEGPEHVDALVASRPDVLSITLWGSLSPTQHQTLEAIADDKFVFYDTNPPVEPRS